MNNYIVSKLLIILFLVYKSVLTQTIYNCSTNSSCGCSANSAILTRIVGGEAAGSGTWGWAASLRRALTGSHFCGGSIISPSYILTAAHCTQNLVSPSDVRVVVGSIYVSSSGQSRTVSKIINHPNYNQATYLNDISILKLSTPLDLTQIGVDSICLPSVSSAVLSSAEYPPPNTNLVAIGWGVTFEGSQFSSSVLRQVTVQSVPASSVYCAVMELTDSSKQFCAGVMPEGGKDTCQGDSGGPLMMFTANRVWELVGITSNGYGCARPGYPGLYTRVAAYQNWIDDTINHAQRLTLFSYTLLISLVRFALF